jgi:hypothetical protein
LLDMIMVSWFPRWATNLLGQSDVFPAARS